MLDSRQLRLTQSSHTDGPVVYVMSRDQRVQDNHALLAAQSLAQKQNTSLYVLFILKKLPTRSREHYEFMLAGLREVAATLDSPGIPFILRTGNGVTEIMRFTSEVAASAIFFDFSPLRGAKSLAEAISRQFQGSVTIVDTHNIIPAWAVSDKREFAAHTMRKKVHRKLEQYLIEPAKLAHQVRPKPIPDTLSFDEATAYVQSVAHCGITVSAVPGEQAAGKLLASFITHGLGEYAFGRNDIACDLQSGLSPYLHFGHVSTLRVALEVMNAVKEPPLLVREATLAKSGLVPSRADGMNALFEEMIIRKELADNFCYYTNDYSSLEAAPDWAQKALQMHSHDPRDFVYTVSDWESAATHDPAWNAAQQELLTTGKIHGYMRMYWAKKILEWSASPDEAIHTAVYLNDKYSIDGGDPNGYVGILWSIAGLHDRPWFERPVYGAVRYMNDSGLRRKFDVDAYIGRVQSQ